MAIVNIEVGGNALQQKAKQEALQKMADNCVADVLSKVAELSTNKKAIDTLKNPPTLLKSILGIK